MIPGLFEPLPITLVVKLGDDEAVNLAVDVLDSNIPVLVVDYGSWEYYLAILKPRVYTIWVGHGSRDFVDISGIKMDWQYLADLIKGSSGINLVLMCYSWRLRDYGLTHVLPVGFGEIDARVASFMALYLITGNTEFLVNIIEVIKGIIDGIYRSIPLVIDQGNGGGGGRGYDVVVDPDLSKVEAVFYILSIVISVIQSIVGLGVPSSLENALKKVLLQSMANLGAYGWLGILYTLIGMANGSIDVAAGISAIAGFIYGIAGIIITTIQTWVSDAPLWEKLYWSTVTIATIAVVMTSPPGLLGVLLNLALSIVAIVGGILHDLDDGNWWVG